MNKEKAIIGFIGAGGIAKSHALSLNSLRYYYNDSPEIKLEAVSSSTTESRSSFANRFGFSKSPDIEEFFADKNINTVFILGPNKVHYEHLKSAIEMTSVKRIYLEKPVCSNIDEERAIAELIGKHPGVKIQIGFQYLYTSVVREALVFWKSGKFGKPVHFDLKYYHSDYLKKEYRDKRQSRLTPAPDGGAMADLGSHIISLLIAFLGNRIIITSALQSGRFDDVVPDSDLFSLISLYDDVTKAVGTISSSRISSGTGDFISFELYAEKGALRFSSFSSDCFEYYLEESGTWNKQFTGSNYKPFSSFPSSHVPSGWMRSMIHAHYVFLTESDNEAIVPDINHGLAVQRLVRQTAEYLNEFRDLTSKKQVIGNR
jgi:predicted dehydrogenase